MTITYKQATIALQKYQAAQKAIRASVRKALKKAQAVKTAIEKSAALVKLINKRVRDAAAKRAKRAAEKAVKGRAPAHRPIAVNKGIPSFKISLYGENA